MEKSVLRRAIAIITVRTVHPRDYDGLSASTKHYLDAICHLGIIEDDSPEHLETIFNAEKCDSYSEEETTIEIWEEPE